MHYFLKIHQHNKSTLSAIRNWGELKVAFEGEEIWVTNFSEAEIEAPTVKKIPYKEIFYSQDGLLFPLGSLLPCGREPSFLWTPIERALPIEIDQVNHNFFEADEQILINIIPTEIEKTADVMLTDKTTLADYIVKAPAFRLNRLKWVMIGVDQVLIFGTPLLPIPSKTFWKNGSSLIPVGFDFELPILSKTIEKQVNSGLQNWVVWNTDGTYFLVNRLFLEELSLGSFRKSIV